jgi:hypothetical protein
VHPGPRDARRDEGVVPDREAGRLQHSGEERELVEQVPGPLPEFVVGKVFGFVRVHVGYSALALKT